MIRVTQLLAVALVCLPVSIAPGQSRQAPAVDAALLSGLRLRGIGPALKSGRIADVEVDPSRRSTWYVGTASGGVWKTVNAGTTWEPIFDHHGSYSIGSITLDPRDPQIVWLGTGENTSQRSVAFGDGVYKSEDGGRTWRNVGLVNSEHIGKIVVDPRDSRVVLVAAQGPLWAPGGDRGLYKTTDGGATWRRVLHVSENTGISDVAFDPRNPDVVYAASYQRRRHVGVLIAGGPESTIFKSTDGGETWREIDKGLPEGDIGRIGIAVSPIDPDVVYALVAAAGKNSGFFRSSDQGETWVRQSDYIVVDPQYYMELYPDPHRLDRVYSVDVNIQVTEDGGKTWTPLPDAPMHVDHHEIVFDPQDPDYLMVGNDGGLYQSWDRGQTWKFVHNLPLAQFYRIAVDNAAPFYNVLGGAQDNGTQRGPSRTASDIGIQNRHWISVGGGDGMQPRVDPRDPGLIYAQSQYGALTRVHLETGEVVRIKPRDPEGEDSLRWYWTAPLVISPHAPSRLYFAANRLFRSDDRGDSWQPVSPDLTRQIDRDTLRVMGRVWGPDAVWKHVFTSPLGTIVALEESPLTEGLIYVGTDDGLIQVTEDGGRNWRRIERFPGVPEYSYVADLWASPHDPDVVVAVFNNHQQGDFRPYVLRSTDRGRSWQPIASGLPERGPAWSVVGDDEDPNLLFLGTEFGLYVTVDGGGRWVRLSGGLPVISFRDLAIQPREDDLVAGSFGRGVFILDDYSPLRHLTAERLASDGTLFPLRSVPLFHPQRTLGGGPQSSLGNDLYYAENPPYGAVFTYHLREPADSVVLTVHDAAGQVVREIAGERTAGLHRTAWDLRRPATVRPGQGRRQEGELVPPGRYVVTLAKRSGGRLQPLGEPQPFEVVPLMGSSGAATSSQR